MMADIRLIAMDMDGTLLDESQRIPEENVKALREASARGVKLAICSGRLTSDASYFAEDAGLDDCAILGLNGAYGLMKPHGEPFVCRYMRKDALDACIRVLEENRVVYSCFAGNAMAVSRAFVTGSEEKAWATNIQRRGSGIVYTVGMAGVYGLCEKGVNKIVYVERESRERLRRVREAIEGVRGVKVTSSWVTNIEMMPEGVDKGMAVRELAERIGVRREEVMCVGDYDNDVEMVAYAGLGVAMGNGSEAVKLAADVVTGRNDEAGVAQAVRRYVLGE